MEITIKKTVEEKATINFPYYSMNSCFSYKAIDEKKTLVVMFGLSDCFIQIYPYIPEMALDATQCTEQEFNEKFNEVLTILNNLK